MTSDPAGMIELILKEGYEAYLHAKYPNYESRADDLRQLAAFAGQYSSCQDFLSELALLTSMEGEDQPAREGDGDGMMTLSSVHQAKGLEWSVVFIIWLAEGRFPSLRSLSESGGEGEEEERQAFLRGRHPGAGRTLSLLSEVRRRSGRKGDDPAPLAVHLRTPGEGYERLDLDEWLRW